jgi:GAF domain-containing protein
VELGEAWQALLEVAVDVAGADSATLTAIDADEPDRVDVMGAAGALEPLRGQRIPDGKSVTRAVLDTGLPVIVRDAASDPRTATLAEHAPGVVTVLAAPLPPIHDNEAALPTVLSLTRTADQPSFRELETEMVHGFATQAATTLALARARHDRERVHRLEDRERALEGLQQTVFSQLQRSSLTLANIAGQVEKRFRDMLLDQIDVFETLTRTIRDTMFDVPR